MADERAPRPGRVSAAAVPTAVLAAFLAAACLGCDGDADRVGPANALSLAGTLGGADTAGYARAVASRPFHFPEDHGPHPTFRTEWWYVTGNLSAADGRAFGFQLTIFRNALAPAPPESSSAWATNQAYMAHFTVTDVAEGRFHAFERFDRGAAGLAGANVEPLRVWLEDWSLEGGADGTFPMRLVAAEEGVALSLELMPDKPLVLQGDRGLSRKGPEPGNASYYYAYSRLSAEGELRTEGGVPVHVSGRAWLDREWSTSALSDGQVGWDWFALQLDDGWDVMLYRLRRADGSADPFSDGVLVDPTGARVPLEWGVGLAVDATGAWTSPVDGARYPSGWRIRVPERGWDLTVEPLLDAQELALAFRYWEGAVRVRGRGDGGRDVAGRGYVELTGYGAPAPRLR